MRPLVQEAELKTSKGFENGSPPPTKEEKGCTARKAPKAHIPKGTC